MKRFVSLILVVLSGLQAGSAQELFSNEDNIIMVNLKKYKLYVEMQGKVNAYEKERQLEVRLCDPSAASPALQKEINQKGIKNIPSEKLTVTLPYTVFETQKGSLSFLVAYVPLPEQYRKDTCLRAITLAFAKNFEATFDYNNCTGGIEEGSPHIDAYGEKRTVYVRACADKNHFTVYKAIYFDDRIYFLAAYANKLLITDSDEFNMVRDFFGSFKDKP